MICIENGFPRFGCGFGSQLALLFFCNSPLKIFASSYGFPSAELFGSEMKTSHMQFMVSLILLLLIQNCSLNKIIQHHGIHNLELKQKKLKINETNKNDIFEIIGPPSTKSKFDNDVFIYIERKTSSSRLTRLGKKVLIKNKTISPTRERTRITKCRA